MKYAGAHTRLGLHTCLLASEGGWTKRRWARPMNDNDSNLNLSGDTVSLLGDFP